MSSLGTLSQSLLIHYINRNNTTLDTLDGATHSKMGNFITDVYNNLGIFLLAYDGYRTFEQQQDLYNKYLSGGNLAAPPGQSWHEYRRAVDFMPLNSDGTNGFNNMTFQDWQIVHGFAEQRGLCHGHSFGDDGHIWNADGNCNTSLTAWRTANNIPLSSSAEWKAQQTAPTVNTAGANTTFLIIAGIGLIISESLRKK